MIMIGGDLHVFACAGTERLHHITLNEQNGYAKHEEDVDTAPENMSTSVVAVVYSESRNSIIMFCNTRLSRHADQTEGFNEFSLSTKRWNIRTYPEIQNERLGDAAMICTADGRYLITFGGRTNRIKSLRRCGRFKSEKLDKIIVYDLEDHSAKPIVSPIQCPVKGGVQSLTMIHAKSDELVTFGFIRRCFKSQEMSELQLMPIYLMDLIAKWVETEWVYLLESAGKGHWRMRVDDILKSVDCSSMESGV